MNDVTLITGEMMSNIEKRIEVLKAEKTELQTRLTNLRCYLQGPLSMGGGCLEKIEESYMVPIKTGPIEPKAGDE